MKKLFPHIIYIPIIIFFIVFANIKASEAEKQTAIAQVQSELALRNAEDAKMQAELAEMHAVEAVKQAVIARDLAEQLKLALEKCL